MEGDPVLDGHPGIRTNVVAYTRRLGRLGVPVELESTAVSLALARLELLLYIPLGKHQTVNGPATLVRISEQVMKGTRLLERALGRPLLRRMSMMALPDRPGGIFSSRRMPEVSSVDEVMEDDEHDDGPVAGGDEQD